MMHITSSEERSNVDTIISSSVESDVPLSTPAISTVKTNSTSPSRRSKSLIENLKWFHSLPGSTKRYSTGGVRRTERYTSTRFENINNNNNASVGLESMSETLPPNSHLEGKIERNVFQRWKEKMCLHLHSFRRQKQHQLLTNIDQEPSVDDINHFERCAPQIPLRYQHQQYNINNTDEPDMVPFTLHYKRFVEKKWLEHPSGPNKIMYKASLEMLSQVWYWGEISRCDAQKQLTDKPTGSFLVRDSETSGSQFTLSFRIVNVTLHYRLEYRDNYWHFEELQYESIVEMIEDILYRCTNDNFVCFVRVPNEMQPPFPVILKYPLSRYLRMPLLQDLCRRVIQRHLKDDEVTQLPIPPRLCEYLSERRELHF